MSVNQRVTHIFKNLALVFSILLGTLLSSHLSAADKNHIFLVCERQKDIRWLRVFSSGDGKCKTVYSKDGYTQVVSSATFYASCEAVMLNVKKNIEEGGFKCKEEKLASLIEIN